MYASTRIPFYSAQGCLTRLRRSWTERFPACAMRTCPHRGKLRLKRRIHGTSLNGAWYCSEACFDAAVRSAFDNTASGTVRHLPDHRLPIGLLLLARNQITAEQLRLALAEQNAQGRGRIGFWLRELGFIGEHDVVSALSRQWSCPAISMAGLSVDQCPRILPAELILDLRLLPLQFAGKPATIYAAFSTRVDYIALNVIERMLNCRTEQCVISDTEMDSALARIVELAGPSLSGGNDVVFQKCGGCEQMARLVSDYTLRLQAREVRIAPCGRHFWVRLLKDQQFVDLLLKLSRPELPVASLARTASDAEFDAQALST